MNYSRYLNTVSLSRKPSPIREIAALLARCPPSVISLAAGNPNPDNFPFKEAQFTLRDGTKFHVTEDRMKMALQYSPSQGIGPLVNWLKSFQQKLHRMPDDGTYDVAVLPGSQDGQGKSFEMLVSPGDNVLVESPTYSGALASLRPLGCRILPVKTDHNGLIPSSLREALSQWTPGAPDDQQNPVPKILYTVPNGVNPTGASLTLERKQEIYEIAHHYELLIIEDDPYYFLQFNKPHVPSFLSLDVDGRVLRLDSFSKTLGGGLRLGYVTGPKPLIDRIILHVQVTSCHASTMSQVMVYDLLNSWDCEGYQLHCEKVVKFYKHQKDVMLSAANKWLTGLAEWNEPVSGMFLWLKVKGIDDTKDLIEKKAVKKEVLFVPGNAFMVDSSLPCSYLRASFSIATPQQIDTGFQRLAELIREELAENKDR